MLLSATVQAISLASPPTGAVTAAMASGDASVSADGRFVAFQSDATDLVPGQSDGNNGPDVFLFDRTTGAVTLLSGAYGSDTFTADGPSRDPVISSDGSYVVFVTDATNISSGVSDTNAGPDVWTYSLQWNVTQLISHAADDEARTGNAGSCIAGDTGLASAPSISANGDWIAFESSASNLVYGATDNNGATDVFLAHRLFNTVALVSHAAGSPNASADSTSRSPVLSADGGTIAFNSVAGNLVDGQSGAGGNFNEFISDGSTVRLVTASAGTTTTTATGETPGDRKPAISDDGRFLAFASQATDLLDGQSDTAGTSDIFLFDRDASGPPLQLLSHTYDSAQTAAGGDRPSISADGARTVFQSSASSLFFGYGDSNSGSDIVLYDQQAGALALVSHSLPSTTSAGNGISTSPMISADGTAIVFASTASDLSADNDANGAADVFLYSVSDGAISLVSVTPDGASSANGASQAQSLSSDASFVAFTSVATDLVPVDGNNAQDLFLAHARMPAVRLVDVARGQTQTSREAGTDFGPVRVGGSSARLISIANDGNGTLSLDAGSIVVTGPDAGDFAPDLAWPLSIAPGATGALRLKFSPSATGDRTALITLNSDDPADAYAFTVTGSGATLEQIPGWSNPWLAAQPDLTTLEGDSAPFESPDLVTQLAPVPGSVLMFTASGSAGFDAGSESGPNGSDGFLVVHAADNGISGISADANALVGVFLSDAVPVSGNEPQALDFSSPSASPGTDYLQLSPLLGQVFFIGDGKTSGGVPHQVVVPDGATRLFLGTLDGTGWYNNVGSFQASIQTGTPQTISGTVYWDSNTNGVNDGDPGLAGAAVYVDLNNNQLLDAAEPCVVTPSSGTYQFTEIAPANYWVRVIPPANYGPVQPADNAREINLTSGQNSQSNNFGEALVASAAVVSYQGTVYSPGGAGVNLFGDVYQGGNGTVDFTLANAGTTSLVPTGHSPVVVSADPNAAADYSADFTVIVQPSPGVLPGDTTDFEIQFSPSHLGPETANITLHSNDPTHPAYTITVGGTGTTPPSLTGTVYWDENADGSNETEPGLPGATVYIDTNNNSVLDDGEPSVITDNTGTYAFSAPLSGNYWVRLISPANYGPLLPGNDAYEANPDITGDLTHAFPEVLVASAAVVKIGDVNFPPDNSDNTLFGSPNVGDSTQETFTITNAGDTALLIPAIPGSDGVQVGGAYAADFVVTQQPAAQVAPGDSTTFTVRFTASQAINETADITLYSNDPVHGTYTITVGGTGVALLQRPQLMEYLGKGKDTIYNTGLHVGDNVGQGYHVDQIWDDETDGFFALGLLNDKTNDAVVSIRGSSQNSVHDTFQDVIADFNSQGVGVNQFNDHMDVEAWITGQIAQGRHPSLTAHSLGGSLAQLFAADLTHNGYQIGDVYTFNSPGIARTTADEFDPALAGTVHHYVTAGDIVSMPGEAFIAGAYTLSYFHSANPLDKHLSSVLQSDKPGDISYENYDSVDQPTGFGLNSPLFFYRDADWLRMLAAVQAASYLPGLGGLSTIPSALLFRGSTETLRLQIGAQMENFFQKYNFTTTGTGVKFALPKVDFNLSGLVNFHADNLGVTYTETATGAPVEVKITGTASLPDIFGASADFSEAGGRYISVTQDGWNAVGSIHINDIPIVPGIWEVRNVTLNLDTVNSSISGSGTLLMPGGLVVSAGLGFVGSQLNNLSLDVNGLNIPVPVAGLFVNRIAGSVDHIADNQGISFTGGLGVSVGPSLNLPQIPSWAGGPWHGSLLGMDSNLNVSWDSAHLAASDTFGLFGGMGTLTGGVDVNWASKTLDLNGDVNLLNGLITAHADLNIDSSLNVSLLGDASLQIPSNIPFVGGKSLAQGHFMLQYVNDNTHADDFVALWGSVDLLLVKPIAGVEVYFNGTVKQIGGKPLDARRTPGQRSTGAAQTFAVPGGEPWALFDASWINDSGNAHLTLTTPAGKVLDEAQIAASGYAAIVDNLNDTTHRYVVVKKPAAGNWKLSVSSTDDLGAVSYAAEVATPLPTLTTGTISGGNKTPAAISLTATDPSSTGRVQLFYDTDNRDFNGLPITTNLATRAARQTYTWTHANVPNGTYYVYAIVTDGQNAPVAKYFPTPVTIRTTSVVSVKTTDAHAAQTGDPATFRFTRTGPTDKPLTVTFRVASTVTGATDFAPLGTQVVFPAGVSSIPVVLQPVDDQLIHKSDTVTLSLAPSRSYALSKAKLAKAVITSSHLPVPHPAAHVYQVVGRRSIALKNNVSTASFGSVTITPTGPRETFQVRNTGDAVLKITRLILPAGYKLVQKPVLSVAPGHASTFVVQVLRNARSGMFHLLTNDTTASPFNVKVKIMVRAH